MPKLGVPVSIRLMTDRPERYTFDRVVRMVLSALTLVALFALLRYLSDVLVPFAAAVVLAYLLNPMVNIFERKTESRPLAVGMTLGLVVVVAIGAVLLLVPIMFAQVSRFQDDLRQLREDLAASTKIVLSTPQESGDSPRPEPGTEIADSPEDGEPSENDEPKTAIGWNELMEGWSKFRENEDEKPRGQRLAELHRAVEGTYIGSAWESMRRYLSSDEFNKIVLDLAKRAAASGWSVVTFTINLLLGLTGLIIVLLYLIFLLLDYPEYERTWRAFLPPQYRAGLIEFWEQFDDVLRRYFRGQAVVALLVGVVCATGFTLIGLPMAVPFGLFVGLLNMVPYLQTVAIIPGAMLAILRTLEGASFAGSLLLVLLVFGVAQLLQDAVIVPRVMGKATGLKPVAILLGVFIWGKLLGFLGLLLAIPLTCLGIAYYRRFVLHATPAEAGTFDPDEDPIAEDDGGGSKAKASTKKGKKKTRNR